MKLNLKKPIIFFDLETTGISITNDRIVQLSYIKVMPNGEEKEDNIFVNPEMHIPESSTAVHHITDEMVADKPTFKQLAKQLEQIFKGCDLAGYNSNRFDVPLLLEEFLRAGVNFDIRNTLFVDVQNIFYKKEPRTLVAAYRFYCHRELDGAHSADNDTRATYEVLQSQLDYYDDLQNDVEWLQEYTRMNRNVDPMGAMVYDDQHRPCFNFGKHKGRPVTEVLTKEPSYYAWMINGDFARSTKQVLTQIKLSMMSK
jgi:DNA polymerase-3 subunit epsilon